MIFQIRYHDEADLLHHLNATYMSLGGHYEPYSTVRERFCPNAPDSTFSGRLERFPGTVDMIGEHTKQRIRVTIELAEWLLK